MKIKSVKCPECGEAFPAGQKVTCKYVDPDCLLHNRRATLDALKSDYSLVRGWTDVADYKEVTKHCTQPKFELIESLQCGEPPAKTYYQPNDFDMAQWTGM